jgi:hypothetical protein
MDLFPREFVPELNNKNLGNSPRFPAITYTTLSAKWFRSYRISTINVAAEFCSRQNSGGTDLQFSISDWPNLLKSRIPFWMTTLSDFQWSIKWLQTVSDLRVTSVGNSTGHELPENSSWAPRKFIDERRRRRTHLSAGYSYESFRHTVWSLQIFEVRLWCWTDSGLTDVGMEFSGLGA